MVQAKGKHKVELLHALKDWVLKWGAHPFAPLALFLNAFGEAVFFPVPPDLLLIAMCLATAAAGKPHLAFLFAAICTVGSVSGGVCGYFIGLKGGSPVAEKLYAKEKIAVADKLYGKYGIWAVAVAGFTPVPYCIFTVLSGVLRLELHKFIVVSILSRGARFFLVATLIFFFGERIAKLLDNTKLFGGLTLLFMLLLLGGYFVLHHFSKKHIKKQREETDGHVVADDEAAE